MTSEKVKSFMGMCDSFLYCSVQKHSALIEAAAEYDNGIQFFKDEIQEAQEFDLGAYQGIKRSVKELGMYESVNTKDGEGYITGEFALVLTCLSKITGCTHALLLKTLDQLERAINTSA